MIRRGTARRLGLRRLQPDRWQVCYDERFGEWQVYDQRTYANLGYQEIIASSEHAAHELARQLNEKAAR